MADFGVTEALGLAGLGLSGAGALTSYGGSKQQAAAALAMGQAQNVEAQREANNALVNASQKAQEQSLEGKVVGSNALAAAAASGGGVETPTVMDVLGKISGRSEYLTGTDIANGQNAANALAYKGQLAEYGAGLQAKGIKTAANANLLSSFGSLASGGYKLAQGFGGFGGSSSSAGSGGIGPWQTTVSYG